MAKKSVVDVKAQPGELEHQPHPGVLWPQAFKAEGIEIFFGVWGGHMWPTVDETIKAGIKNVTTRDEMSASHAAEAYARVTGKIGVCYGTVGPGTTSLTGGMHQAHLSDTPVMALVAGHESTNDGMITLQEAYAEKIYESFCKLSKRVINVATWKFWIRKAIRTAMEPPRGPVMLEWELNAVGGPMPASQANYLENWLKEPMLPSRPDPKAVEKALEIIYSAEKPVLYAGDTIMWEDAAAELREFAHLAQIPTMGRRGGRGAFREDDPLIWKSGEIGAGADLFIILGARMDFFDFFGGRFGIKKAIQIQDCDQYMATWLPTEVAIKASVKATLQDMIAYIKKNNPSVPAARASWLAQAKETQDKVNANQEKRALQFKDLSPVHPAWLSKCVVDKAAEMYKDGIYYIADGFTSANILSPYIKATFPGQILDSGPHAGVGHGVGMAIGASFGCKKKKMVLAMMGDAGMGRCAGDIETAIRWKLPIVYLVSNNNGWSGGSDAMYGKNLAWYGTPPGEPVPHYAIPDQRYDLMYEAIGCHGAWVTDPTQVMPELEKAFKAAEAGKTAVVNVKVDRRPVQSILDSPICASFWHHLPWNETTRYMRKMRAKFMYDVFPFAKYGIKAEDIKYDRWDLQEEDFELGIPED